MTLLNGGQRCGDSPTKLRVLGAARKSEVKATQNLSIIVAFFAVCWMPLYTINCVQAFCVECTVPSSLLNACIVLSHLNSAGNPLLYAYHLKDFRNAFKSLLLCNSRYRGRGARSHHNQNVGTVNDCSVSSLTYSGGTGSTNCWPPWSSSRSVIAAAESLQSIVIRRQQSSGNLHQSKIARTTTVAALIIEPSAPILLSVRRLVE